MKVISVFGAIVAMAAPVVTIQPALAATQTITYTGSVAEGTFDYGGVFGTPSAYLSGLAYTAVFVLDTSLGIYASGCGDGYCYSQYYGGQYNGSTSPVTAILNINGKSHVFLGTSGFSSSFSDVATGVYSQHQDQVHDGISNDDIYGYAHSFDDSLIPASVTEPFNIYAYNVIYRQLYFQISTPIGVTYSNGYDSIASVISSAAPEPASWALMIAGMGAVGGAMRRRKVRVAYA
ncbi:MAG: PEPxxWA-CTERM sorting domain-containing protein [Novosphingobium sp.]